MKVTDRIGNLLGRIADGISTFLMWVLYFVIGFIMAVPYTYLAGWDTSNLFFTACVMPIVALVLCALYVARKDNYSVPWRTLRVFWGFLGYSMLPIFANGISIVLKWFGFPAVGSFIFELRYISLIVVPIVSVMMLLVCSFAKSIWQRKFSRRAVPPSDAPPSEGFSQDKAAIVSPREERKNTPNVFQLVPT
jgi:hypothetical protein